MAKESRDEELRARALVESEHREDYMKRRATGDFSYLDKIDAYMLERKGVEEKEELDLEENRRQKRTLSNLDGLGYQYSVFSGIKKKLYQMRNQKKNQKKKSKK